MNKIKTTKTEMRQNYRILSIGYCDAQSLLTFESPIAYSAGTYGWACDYYLIRHPEVGEVIISTGYSPISTKNMIEDYKLIREYEEKARKENTREGHNKVLMDFIKKCTPEVK